MWQQSDPEIDKLLSWGSQSYFNSDLIKYENDCAVGPRLILYVTVQKSHQWKWKNKSNYVILLDFILNVLLKSVHSLSW